MAEEKRGTIGIDVGGTKTLFALFDEKFDVVAERKIRTGPDKGGERFEEKAEEALGALKREAKSRDIEIQCAGAGCAGFIDNKKGIIVNSPNIPFLKDFPLGDRLESWLDAPAVLLNDVHAGLTGEHAFGAAQGCASAIGLFVGTGIGGAILIDGRIYTGASGAAGEVGHYLTDPMGPLAGSGRHGILDNIVSRTAIAGEAAVLATKQWAPHLYKEVGTDVNEIRSDALAQAIKKGDKSVEELVRSRARILGIVMANLVNFLSPEVVVLGGGLVEAMSTLIVKEAESAMREFLIPSVDKTVRVAAAKLKDHSVTTGAAKGAWDRIVDAKERLKEAARLD